MIKSNKQHAYAVAAQFGSAAEGFIACCPYVANTPEVATASVVALIMTETKTSLPLIAVNATELSIEWLRSAIAVIEASEKQEEAEKPKIVQLVSDNLRPAENPLQNIAACPPPLDHFARGGVEQAVKHERTCLRAWGPWGRCSCGADGPGAA